MEINKPEIDPYLFERQLEAFKIFVEEQQHNPFVSFDSHPYTYNEEGSKSGVHKKARKALDFGTWKKSDIGSGNILFR